MEDSEKEITEWMHIITTTTSEGDIDKEESWVALTPPKSQSIDTIFETGAMMKMLGMKRSSSSANDEMEEAWEQKIQKHKSPVSSPRSQKKVVDGAQTKSESISMPAHTSGTAETQPRITFLRRFMKWCGSMSQHKTSAQKLPTASNPPNRIDSPAVQQQSSDDCHCIPAAVSSSSSTLGFAITRARPAAPVPGRGRLQSDEATEHSDDDDGDEDDVIDEDFLRTRMNGV